MKIHNTFFNANELVRKGDYENAIHIYRQLIIKNPEFIPYAKNLAFAAYKAGHEIESSLFHLQAYLLDPSDSASLLAASKLKKTNSNKNDLVLVLIPAFNAEKTIIESVNSVLFQDHKDILVVVIDDGSSDRTYELISDLQKNDNRIFIIRNPVNKGAFYSVNIGLFLFRWLGFHYYLKHDADDKMFPHKIKKQVEAIKNNKNAYFCTSDYERVDFFSKKVISLKKRGHNMTLFKSDVFRKIGYYDINAFGADTEYLERAVIAYGKGAEIYLNDVLTKAYLMSTGLVAKNPLGSVSRQEYQATFRANHLEMNKSKFFYRNFRILEDLLQILRGDRQIVCGVATILDRKEALSDAVTSILPQVDKLIIYQNDYKEIFDFLRHEKIEVISALDTLEDIGDAGKYYKINDFNDANYFSIDDDLNYPSNYVDILLDLLYRFDGRVIVTAHGRVVKPRVKSYYDDALNVFHFSDEVNFLCAVHFGGTGVMAFNTRKTAITFSEFKYKNMADVWMGHYAQRKGIPILVVPHSKSWISQSEKFSQELTIFKESKNKNPKHQRTKETINITLRDLDFQSINTVGLDSGNVTKAFIIQANSKNFFLSDHKSIAIAIPSYNRKELLVRLVNQLDMAAKCFNVRLMIFDDGSETPVENIFFDVKNIKDIEIVRYQNHGKKRYWSLVNKIFDRLSLMGASYNFYLGDDLEVGPSFFLDAINQWELIEDEKKISLNLLRDGRIKSWTNFERVERNFSGLSVFQTQWLDMIMMFDHKLLSYRLKKIPMTRWDRNPLLSSGVGAQLSHKLNEMGYTMYQVKTSLVVHADHVSQMNPEERILNPLVSVH
jgi:glycosyltransferase involved in cell wall biosynthesis